MKLDMHQEFGKHSKPLDDKNNYRNGSVVDYFKISLIRKSCKSSY